MAKASIIAARQVQALERMEAAVAALEARLAHIEKMLQQPAAPEPKAKGAGK